MPKFTPEQIAARELVWKAAVGQANDEGNPEPLTLSAKQVAALWRSIADTGIELVKMRDALLNYRLHDPTIRTEAVELALKMVRRTGKTSMRDEDGRPSKIAHSVGYALLRGAEAVQQEIDRFAELTQLDY